jgi:hypothetical protein
MYEMIDLIKMFDERTEGLEEHLSRDEWFFCTLREGIISELSPAEAFELLPQAATLILREQQYDYRWSECVQLLLSLARHTGTTELPPELSVTWPDLFSRICSFGEYEKQQASELCRWYRKDHPAKQSSRRRKNRGSP